jgi:zinc transporter ZupT
MMLGGSPPAMKSRFILAALLGGVGVASAVLAARIRAVEPSSSWLFAVFAAFFLVLAGAAAMPGRKREPKPVRFVSAFFLDTALFAFAVLVALAIAANVLSRFRK